MTFVSDGRQKIVAHKVILSAYIPFFGEMLKQNNHSHPLIYMRWIKVKDLVSIVHFIYHGYLNKSLDTDEEVELRRLAYIIYIITWSQQSLIMRRNMVWRMVTQRWLQTLPMQRNLKTPIESHQLQLSIHNITMVIQDSPMHFWTSGDHSGQE